MYKALIKIGEYKKGDIVPDEKAKIWETMYTESPVEKVGGESPKEEINMDLNGDGKVDAKDRSIAAKVMHTGRKKGKKRK